MTSVERAFIGAMIEQAEEGKDSLRDQVDHCLVEDLADARYGLRLKPEPHTPLRLTDPIVAVAQYLDTDSMTTVVQLWTDENGSLSYLECQRIDGDYPAAGPLNASFVRYSPRLRDRELLLTPEDVRVALANRVRSAGSSSE